MCAAGKRKVLYGVHGYGDNTLSRRRGGLSEAVAAIEEAVEDLATTSPDRQSPNSQG